MTNAQSVPTLLDGFSMEVTGKDVAELGSARTLIPSGTRVNVTFLASEDLSLRVDAAEAVLAAGFVPVPHISARRVRSRAELEEFLVALREVGALDSVFMVGGDPHSPQGPYGSALDVLRTGLLAEHGVRNVSISGYPEGHPDIAGGVLWDALQDKAEVLKEQGLQGSVITQFGFDEAPVFSWIEQVRDRGIELPVRVGVPGPAGVKRLLALARRFGVSSSAVIARKYGFSLTNLMGTAGPDKLLQALADGYDSDRHGSVHVHFYTFGGVAATAEWIRDFTAGPASADI